MYRPGSKAAALAAGLLGLAAAAVPPARAADDGYANVFSSVLGSVGLIKGDATPDIEYRERPPLVLPKDAALPKPALGGAKRTAAWPQDPDVLKHRKEAEEARAPHTLDPSLGDHGTMLSRDEMAKGRIADGGSASQEPVRDPKCGNDGNHCLLLSPDDLRAQHDAFEAANPEKDTKLVAGQEQQREFLTQPPKGYMKPAKVLKATTEAPEKHEDAGTVRYMREQELKHQAEQLQ